MDKIAEIREALELAYVDYLPGVTNHIEKNAIEWLGYLLSELEMAKQARDEAVNNWSRMVDKWDKAIEERDKAIEALRWYAGQAEEEARRFHFGQARSGIGFKARETLRELGVSE